MNRDVVMVSWDGDAEVMVYEYRAVEGSTLVKVHGPFTSSPAAFTPLLSQPERVLEWVATGAGPCRSSSTGTTHHASLRALLAETCGMTEQQRARSLCCSPSPRAGGPMRARVVWDRIDYARLRTPTPRSRSRGGVGAQ